jgi:hypothetical protein
MNTSTIEATEDPKVFLLRLEGSPEWQASYEQSQDDAETPEEAFNAECDLIHELLEGDATRAAIFDGDPRAICSPTDQPMIFRIVFTSEVNAVAFMLQHGGVA